MQRVIVITLEYSSTIHDAAERAAKLEVELKAIADKFNKLLATEIEEAGVTETTPIHEALKKFGGEYYTTCHRMSVGQLYIPANELSLCFNGSEFRFPDREKLEAMATHLLDNYNYYLIG